MGSAPLNLTNQLSISCWVYFDQNDYSTIISKHGASQDHGWMIKRHATNSTIEWRVSTDGSNWEGGKTSSGSAPINQWLHIVAMYDGVNMRVFINGNEDTFGIFPYPLSGTIYNSSYETQIGENGNTSARMNGRIDDIVLYNREISFQEIQQLYYGSLNYSYSWSPGGETTSSITVQPSATTTYTADVTSGTTTCQSDVTILVNQRDLVSIDSTACDSIQWDGNWLASTGTYVDTLQNMAGCDSIVTLNLTINQSTTGIEVLTACDTLTWIDGITYSASNNTATHTFNQCCWL